MLLLLQRKEGEVCRQRECFLLYIFSIKYRVFIFHFKLENADELHIYIHTEHLKLHFLPV